MFEQAHGLAPDVISTQIIQRDRHAHFMSTLALIACSIDRARRELGYEPLVELREGMRRSVASVLERGGRI